MTLEAAAFGAFFAALNGGRAPFAWQARLLHRLVTDGRWPDVIAAPTGSGKTAVIDVHVFAVALMAVGRAGRLPRRLSVVVDRRALVDSHAERAARIATMLRAAAGGNVGVLRDVALALRGLRTSDGVERDPLVVAVLRGGVAPDTAWRDEPTACAVICATPDMWGSRLLLRGYGTSRHARPREAGLLAYDSVVVVDEAHLTRQLLRTATRIADLEATATRPIGVPMIQVVETTATPDLVPRVPGRAATGLDVRVEAADLVSDPDLARRLRRPKPVTLRAVSGWPAAPSRRALVAAVADEAAALRAAHGPSVGCVLNTVDGAVSVADELRHRGLVVELLVGRMRPWDVRALRSRRPDLLTPTGDAAVDVVVATQTIEVGVDADFSALVTELASGTALAQRAGRVNRLGTRASGPIVVVGPDAGALRLPDALPYRSADLEASLLWLRGRAADADGFAPWALAADPPPPETLRRTLLSRPESWDAWYLARTSDSLVAEPDLDLWLSDDLEADHDVAFVVRQGLPPAAPEAVALLRATPARAKEAFPVPIRVAAAAIAANPAGPWYLVRDDDVSTLAPGAWLRPGDVVYVSHDVRCFRFGVVDAAGTETADDVLEAATDDADDQFLLRLAAGAPSDPGGGALDEVLGAIAATLAAFPRDGRERRAAMADALERHALLVVEPHTDRVRSAARLLRRGRLGDAEILVGATPPDGAPSWIVIADTGRSITDEELRQTWVRHEGGVALAGHGAAVADRAAAIAERLSLSETLIRLLRMSGELHDEGKRDPRFQAMLRGEAGGEDAAPLAKSGHRRPAEARLALARSGLPTGWRHEQLSAAHAWSRLGAIPVLERQLVTRLVGTSHGRGRSGFPHSADGLLDRADPALPAARDLYDDGAWDQLVERTDAAAGIWGCAFLEALLRAADGQVSGEGR